MNPIKKLDMEDARVPESEKDAAYYWALRDKYNDIAEMYNRRTLACLKWAAVFLVIAIIAMLAPLVFG